MAAPPEKKSKDSSTITVILDKDLPVGSSTMSTAIHISGFPWCVRVTRTEDENKAGINCRKYFVSLLCVHSSEAELWTCHASIITQFKIGRDRWGPRIMRGHLFTSWSRCSREFKDSFMTVQVPEHVPTVSMEITIMVKDWRRTCNPILYQLQPKDGILVIGEEKKKMEVNKKTLAAQSPFFDRLFNGDFKEKNMNEIPIGDVEFEEFSNIIKMIYPETLHEASLTDDNVHRVLELADRFDLKIVEDRVMSYLLYHVHSPYAITGVLSSFSLHEKLLISEQYNLPFLKRHLLSRYNSNEKLMELSKSPEWDLISKETLRELLNQNWTQLPKC